MALVTTDISDLLHHLHSSVDTIHRSMRELCDPESHNEVSKLQEECEKKIADLRNRHETTRKEAESRRRAELYEISQRRKKEGQDIADRRKKEDEERRIRIENEEMLREKEAREEDETTERERVAHEDAVTSSAREEIERLEGEMRKRWEEGRVKVRELDEKRKEINKKIDELLTFPVEYPKIRPMRKTIPKTGIDKGIPNPTLSRHFSSYAEDPMLKRLWSGEKYPSERYFQGPSRTDDMLNRLWDSQKYPAYQHLDNWEDPMLNRLWNGEACGKVQRDPMLTRLWSDKRYDDFAPQQAFDPMLCRLWSNDKYPNEEFISVIYNPMIERLWEDSRYPNAEHVAVIYDDMLARLWGSQRYTSNDALSHHDDPMLARLWNEEKYAEATEVMDPMMERLWSATRYTADPMIDRLWGATRYREDPMITRLWASVHYTNDPMLDRLWNGESYPEIYHQNEEPQVVLFASQHSEVKSPIPRSPIPMGLYLHTEKFPEQNVSEVQDISEDEDEGEEIAVSSKRQSGVFTAFFDSIKTDIPLVNDYFGRREYDNVPVEDFDAYVQEDSLLYNAPDEQHVHFNDLVSEFHDFDTETDEEEFPRRTTVEDHLSSTLRIQTSSFPLPPSENPFEVPSSGVLSSPATPSDTESHTFQHLELHDRGVTPDSWSPPREEVHLAQPVDKPVPATNPFTSYMQPSITSNAVDAGAAKPMGKRGVGNHFNSVPQNPRLSVVAEVEGPEEESSGVREKAAFFGRLSRMYYGGSGEERGRLLEGDER